jgi:hypothetical protein
MDEAELARDYLDVLIWPGAVLAVLTIRVTVFREEPRQLINRIQRIRGPGDTELIAHLPESQQIEEREQALPERDLFEQVVAARVNELLALQQAAQLLGDLAETQAALFMNVSIGPSMAAKNAFCKTSKQRGLQAQLSAKLLCLSRATRLLRESWYPGIRAISPPACDF